MKAAQIHEYGDSSVVKINKVADPSPGDGQVLVEVHASSINPIDTIIRAGYLKEMVPLAFPTTLGGDFAGVVEQTGAGVSNVEVGERVYGQSNAAFGNGGAFAEHTVTSAGMVARAPENISLNEAASLPLAGVSAVQALLEHIKLEAGDKILITGASGGIGSIAVQIANHLDAYVVGTGSGEHAKYIKQLGADEAVDYNSPEATRLPNDFDAILNTAGGPAFENALRFLKVGGIGVTLAGQAPEELAKELGVTVISQNTNVTTAALDTLTGFVESGAVKPQVDTVFSLDDVAEAFAAKESGHVAGKVVIEVKK